MINKLCIVLIKTYQHTLSFVIGRQCRFYPTCSCYALQAFQQFSFFKACYLTLKRLVRCQPLCAGGEDPIPSK